MRILLVEDDEMVREFVEVCLVDEAFDVEAVGTVGAALDVMNTKPCPDLLLTDYNLSGQMTGVDLATAMQRICTKVPVLVITGRPDLVKRLGVLPTSFNVLPKPFSIKTLLAAIGTSTRH